MLSHTAVNQSIPLWPNGAPGALGCEDKDIPTLTPYVPTTNGAGTAIVVLPGGGYGRLAAHEGHDYALVLNQHGLAAFVLKYRLGSHGYRHPVMWQDATQAMRLVRSRAAEWNLDPARIGIMGSSAGGHLAATALTQFETVNGISSRPDFGVLCYPVITMLEHAHTGSRDNLLGKDSSPELRRRLSAELNVTSDTPPCFIWHTHEDAGVKVENSLLFAAALRRAGVPFDLHIYEKGRHGLGLADKPPFANAHPWSRDLLFWLRERKFI
jgi:acetyl esterase/lipase